MSALPPYETRRMLAAARRADGAAPAVDAERALADRWALSHAAAARIAQLAELSPDRESGEIAGFPAAIAAADPWRRELAAQGLEDIEAMLRPGLVALEALVAQGGSPVAPALALWREFHLAREALLALARSALELDAA